uniref:hypothetical protein n=1 Tax=Pseudonocardia sp. CA-138482 TaxID=3240023 RepID=UPI003F49793B
MPDPAAVRALVAYARAVKRVTDLSGYDDEGGAAGAAQPGLTVFRVYDGRLCEACLLNDDPDALPVHPNCRCWAELDNDDEQPYLPPRPTHLGLDAHGAHAERFTLAEPIGDAPAAGYVVPDHPDAEQIWHPAQVTESTVAALQAAQAPALREPDAHLAAWIAAGRVVLAVARHLTDRTAARRLAQALAAPVMNLARGSVFGRLVRRRTKAAPARPVLVLLPTGAGPAERAAFVAAVRRAAGLSPGT